MKNSKALAAIAVAALALGVFAGAAPASAAPTALTNTAHLDFLLDAVSPAAIDGHTTYRLAEEPALTAPWTYADAKDDGSFTRVGGGDLDAATGHYAQGAYNADDIARAAVVYLRHWKQTGSAASRQKAYELLRTVAYLQTSSGPNAGNVVLWMQSDGTLTPSPVPVELPNPSDSGASYWLARSLWAFGEGYADFAQTDPTFAAFLQTRISLGVAAVNRESLVHYGQFAKADGVRVPAWLIDDGADVSAEAVLGLSAYVKAAPGDRTAATALRKLAKGIALLGSGSTTSWPYGAILPSAATRSTWHAWSSQMPEALAVASVALHDRSLLKPALADSASFTPTLLTSNGPDNAWYPTPTEKTQIAYGADSRLQSLLAVSDAAHRPGLDQLAAIMGAWYFGMNASGAAVYDPATGVTRDGVQEDGTVNRNSGAESTIHGLLSMLALDAHPAIAKRAVAVASVESRRGLTVVEGESAKGGTVVTPKDAWTGEAQYGGGKYLKLTKGHSATLAVRAGTVLEPVIVQPYPGVTKTSWGRLGTLTSKAGAPGVSEVAGALVPQRLGRTTTNTVRVTTTKGTLALDAIIERPRVSRLVLGGTGGETELVNSASARALTTSVGFAGHRSTVRSYDATGRLVHTKHLAGRATVALPAGGFAVVTR